MKSVGQALKQTHPGQIGANSETGARGMRASRLRDRVDELASEEGVIA